MKGYKHFVVIRRAEGNFVHIGDPALGNRAMSRRNFERAWNGVVFVVLGEGYNPDNVLRNPPSPLSARRLIDHYSPIRSATPEDFGFRNQTIRIRTVMAQMMILRRLLLLLTCWRGRLFGLMPATCPGGNGLVGP